MTYGAEWWLAQLRRAALAQVVSCAPSPRRAAALEAMIRAVEDVSVDARDAQAAACARAGCMPRAFVQPLERMAPLDELLAENADRSVVAEVRHGGWPDARFLPRERTTMPEWFDGERAGNGAPARRVRMYSSGCSVLLRLN